MGLGGATWESTDHHPLSPELRGQLTQLCALLEATGAGLLLTLDEIHRHQVDELRLLAATLQHLFREGAAVAFVGAGLSSSVSTVLNDEVLTFLRRADRHVLGPVAMEDVAQAIIAPIEASGRSIAPADADRAAEATSGYAFMIQLVGYHVWRQHPGARRVTARDVDAGLAAAHGRLGALVHGPTIAALSNVDRRFLLAMAQDEGPSSMGEIAKRLGVSANYASQYRLRLIEADVVEAVGHGRVDFVTPHLRDYLREHDELTRMLRGGDRWPQPAALTNTSRRFPSPSAPRSRNCAPGSGALVPDAVETISYQMPTFKYEGKALVGYAAFTNHLSLFPYSNGVMSQLVEELAAYDTSGKGGTIRFTAEAPLTEAVVEAIVRTRIAEIEARARKG